MEKLKRRQFTAEFKIEAAKLVVDQSYAHEGAGETKTARTSEGVAR